ncbi:hypothetical protein [Caldimonas tepidiphila]|uniref:hypothetical protein n=1 Tax=Caldimonas tepidiphila TaxID=2315841 RepID=UPI000E5AF031|nr:hypothetical protein [Caldimonas tepidiphila]
MSPQSLPNKIQPSTGPRRLRVCRAATMLVIEPLDPCGEHRPVPVDLAVLERFSRLMAAQGWQAHVSRLAYDRIYAGQRFSLAFRRGSDELRDMGHALMARLA